MVEERGGWRVINVKDATWGEHPIFGKRCSFESDGAFPQTGVRLAVLEPGQPACRYHRENAQEDFLVLSGECLVLINDEEHELRQWDLVHCPPGVTHVFVGAGEGPCTILMIGHRPEEHLLHYPRSEKAARWNAQTPEDTPDPRVAYSDVPQTRKIDAPDFPAT